MSIDNNYFYYSISNHPDDFNKCNYFLLIYDLRSLRIPSVTSRISAIRNANSGSLTRRSHIWDMHILTREERQTKAPYHQLNLRYWNTKIVKSIIRLQGNPSVVFRFQFISKKLGHNARNFYNFFK